MAGVSVGGGARHLLDSIIYRIKTSARPRVLNAITPTAPRGRLFTKDLRGSVFISKTQFCLSP